MSRQGNNKTGARILLIEDETTLIELYSVALASLGDVDVAVTAADALDKLHAYTVDTVPDIILLDLIIPEEPGRPLDFTHRWGFNVLIEVRKHKLLNSIPVLVMTNLDAVRDRKEADRLGVIGYIIKSNVVPKDIIKQVSALL